MMTEKETARGQPGGGGETIADGDVSHPDDIPTHGECQEELARRLSPVHLAMLRNGSCIADDVILARGYRTITDMHELESLGFSPAQRRPGLLLPLHSTDGHIGLHILRPDDPRRQTDKVGNVKILKYECPKGAGTRLDCPPASHPMLGDPSIPLWITEGQKKADALASKELCAVALLGVWNWKGRNAAGGTTFLADWDYIALNGRDVHIVFDSDVMVKSSVRLALDRLTEHMQRQGAHVATVYLPTDGASKVGVDDYFAQGHSLQELEMLVESPRPTPKAAPARVELLDVSPATIRRPLTLTDGIAHAGIWIYCRVTIGESTNARGEVVVHNPPIVRQERRLFIIRSDGVIYGGGGDKPLDDLGLDVVLPEVPPDDKLWRRPSVKRYRAGYRPDPGDVFTRVCDVVDTFIDFSRSLTDQRTMAEMIGCYVLATWFLPAFSVIGFLWPNGDRGCGKTQLLLVVSHVAYLGQVILAGGSYASLRDLADYGATLGFDDAENLLIPKQTDPDKRALLLAGNRRGSVVSVKEQTADKVWRTRYVDAFCPRLFSAIRLPDPVLASRSIVVPLIRTADKGKANSDPMDYAIWPHDRLELQDDLWCTALAHMDTIGHYEEAACDGARIQGRALEPWKAILTIAKWLDTTRDLARDGKTLYERMESLAYAYQSERPDLETTDLSVLTVQALLRLYGVPVVDTMDTMDTMDTIEETPVFEECRLFYPSNVLEAIINILTDDDKPGDWVTPDRVGRALGRLRFKAQREGNKSRRRQWHVVLQDLLGLAKAYGLLIPKWVSQYSVHSGLCVHSVHSPKARIF